MIKTIATKEIREKLQSLSFQLTFLIAAILITFSIFTGYQIYQNEVNWHNASKENSLEALANKGSYSLLLQEGNRIMRAPTKLSIFARGVDSVTGKAALVNQNPVIMLLDSRFSQNPVFALFGELDLNFIVTIILSLFAVFFSYSSISGEREGGTLKLVFSSHLSRAQFLLGKAIGGYITLALTYIIPMLLSLFLLITIFNVSFNLSEYSSLSIMLGIHLLYLAVFYCIGLLMSALTRHSLISLLLSLFTWVLFVAVIPRAAIEFASMVSPPPSIEELEKEKEQIRLSITRETSNELNSALKELWAPGKNVSPERHTELVNESLEKFDERINDQLGELYNEYRRKQNRLISTAETISRISPLASVVIPTTRMADTDVQLINRLQSSIATYRRDFIRYAKGKISEHPEQSLNGVSVYMYSVPDGEGGSRMDVHARGPAKPLELNDMPDLTFEAGSTESSFDDVINDFGLLAIEMILIYLVAFVRFIKYDIR